MEEVMEVSSVSGVASEVKLEAAIGVGGSESPICRRSLRALSRSPFSRGRRAKSSPKSPLMRMAEMRKSGLRGRALRKAGKMGGDGSAAKGGKGVRRAGRRGELVLAAIPESSELGDGALGCLELECVAVGGSDEGYGELFLLRWLMVKGFRRMMLVLEREGRSWLVLRRVLQGLWGLLMGWLLCCWMTDPRLFRGLVVLCWGRGSGCSVLDRRTAEGLVGVSPDLALDLISSQPLQDMAFINKRVELPRKGRDEERVGKDCLMVEIGAEEASGGAMNEDFPLLSKENLRNAKGKEKNRGGGDKEVSS